MRSAYLVSVASCNLLWYDRCATQRELGDRLSAQGGQEMTDQEWLRLELKNVEARRHTAGGLASRVARVLRRLF